MDEHAFWDVIDRSRTYAEDASSQSEVLRELLNELDEDEVAEFATIFQDRLQEAYTWDLWGAAHLMLGGCADDVFENFRRWLIAQGQSLFVEAVREPDRLAELLDPRDVDEDEISAYEELFYVPFDVYENLTDETLELPNEPDERVKPHGTPWEEEDLDKRLPKVSARFKM